MSWSINLIGTPEKIVEALEAESERMTGPNKVEFDSVKDGIICIVKANHNSKEQPALSVSAHGSAYQTQTDSYSSCAIEIKNLGKILI